MNGYKCAKCGTLHELPPVMKLQMEIPVDHVAFETLPMCEACANAWLSWLFGDRPPVMNRELAIKTLEEYRRMIGEHP